MSSSSITSLVVESDLRRANQIVASLSSTERFNCRCLRASGMAEALRQLSLHKVDVVISRSSLPGVAYASSIEQLRANASGALIISLLEDEEKSLILDTANRSADDYLFYSDLDDGRLEETVHLSLERRELLGELREIQEKMGSGKGTYRALLHKLDVAVLLVSKPAGELVFANQVAEAWFPESKEGVLAKVFELGALDSESMEIEVELEHNLVPNVELRAVDTLWRGQRCCLLTLRNISRRKRAEESYKASEQRLELALKASNVGLWSWDLRNNLMQFSERWKEQLGFSGHEFPNTFTAFCDALHLDDRNRVESLFQEALRGKTTELEIEYRMRHRDGSLRWILCRAEVFPDASGRLSTLLGTHIDVTESREKAARLIDGREAPLARKLNDRLDRIASALEKHAAQIRSSFRGDSEIVGRIQELERLSRSLSCLNSVLQAKDSGSEAALESIDLGAEVTELYRAQESLLPAKINLRVESRKEVAVSGLSQASLRLALTESLLCVAEHVSVDFKSRILARVLEEGSGDQQKRPCVEYIYAGRQIDDAELASLSNTRNVSAHSLNADGLCVLKLIFGEAASRDEESLVGSGRPLALLAEDEGVLRLAIQAMLESLDYEVVVAEDGAAAVGFFEERQSEFSIALVDLNMPKLDGGSVVRRIRSQRPRLPVIKMSGDDGGWGGEDVSSCEDAFSQVLAKPFGVGELKTAIGEIRKELSFRGC